MSDAGERLSRPRQPLPPGACDCHLHVIGEPARYPFDARRSYTPAPAALADYEQVMQACGIDRAVLVQPSVYGTDNACLLDALSEAQASGPPLRAVAVPAADASDEVLEAMHALGVRGVRLNLVNPQVLGVDDGIALVERMRHRGWHLQLHLRLDAAGERLLADLAERTASPLVVDHFGRPPPGPAPAAMLDLLASGRAWVKLSASYRVGSTPGRGELVSLARALVEGNPDRVLWGSDWPHTELTEPPPRDGDLVDELAAWLPEAGLREKVGVANPAVLYGF